MREKPMITRDTRRRSSFGRLLVGIPLAFLLVALTTLPALAAGPSSAPVAPVVYLTFDVEGRGAPEVLATLRTKQVPATMFLLGNWADAQPALVRQMVTDGHALGHHSYSHPAFTQLSDAAARTELRRAEAAILQASGGASPRPRFRFPYGAGQGNQRLLQLVASEGYRAYFWTVDPQDWRGSSSATITQHVLTHSRNGSIVLLHPAAPGTPGALPAIIDGLRARGFQFATLPLDDPRPAISPSINQPALVPALVQAAPPTAATRTSQAIYIVKPGDTLTAIAQRHGTSVDVIAQANQLTNRDRLQVGQALHLPSTATTRTSQAIYIVKPGDTLTAIAQRHGTYVDVIAQANQLTNRDRLRVGQSLHLP